MTKAVEGVRIFKGNTNIPKPLVSPLPHQRKPFNWATVIVSDSTVPIPEVDEKKGVVISRTEGLVFGKMILGGGGGEVWHTHQISDEVCMYVLKGNMAIWWEERGKEHMAEAGPEDFVHMAAGARQQWFNNGKEDLELIFVTHSHGKLKETIKK